MDEFTFSLSSASFASTLVFCGSSAAQGQLDCVFLCLPQKCGCGDKLPNDAFFFPSYFKVKNVLIVIFVFNISIFGKAIK